MKLNDLNEASLAGALMSKLGAKLRGGPEAQMSTADLMAQKQFTKDLITQLANSLAQGINGGIVDPDPKAGAGSPPSAPTTPQPTPAQIRQQKQAIATQNARAQMKEGQNDKFSKLNQIFESIVKLDEANYPYTISSYVQNFVKKFLGNVDVTALKSISDEVQQTYAQDKGQKALTKLASAAYSLYHTGGAGAGGNQPRPVAPAATPASSTSAAPTAAPQKVQSVYKQVKGLMGQLNKQQKGYILKSLQKEIGNTMSQPPANKIQENKEFKHWGNYNETK